MPFQDNLHIARADLLVEAVQRQPQQTQHLTSCAATSFQSPRRCDRIPHVKTPDGLASRACSGAPQTATFSTLPSNVRGCEGKRNGESVKYWAACAHVSPKRSSVGMAV